MSVGDSSPQFRPQQALRDLQISRSSGLKASLFDRGTIRHLIGATDGGRDKTCMRWLVSNRHSQMQTSQKTHSSFDILRS